MEMDKKKMPDFMWMFQGRDLDLSQFSRSAEIYTQSTTTVADTIWNNRTDVYIPWKPVFLDGLSQIHEVLTVLADGNDLPAYAATTTESGLSSLPDQIESLQFLHGNGAGEIIYEISGSAYAYLCAMFQGCKDPTKYGMYINTQAAKSAALNGTDVDYSNLTTFAGSSTTQDSLLNKIQMERYEIFKWGNSLAADDQSIPNGAHWGLYSSYCLEDDTSFPLWILPLIIFIKGVTVWTLWRTDSWNCVPKKAIACPAALAADVAIGSTEVRFKLENTRIITSEILLSTDLQRQFYDYIEENEYVSFPCV